MAKWVAQQGPEALGTSITRSNYLHFFNKMVYIFENDFFSTPIKGVSLRQTFPSA